MDGCKTQNKVLCNKLWFSLEASTLRKTWLLPVFPSWRPLISPTGCFSPEWKSPEPILYWYWWCDGSLLPKLEVRSTLWTHQLLPRHQPCGQVAHVTLTFLYNCAFQSNFTNFFFCLFRICYHCLCNQLYLSTCERTRSTPLSDIKHVSQSFSYNDLFEASVAR